MVIPIDPKGEKLAWGINTSIVADKSREEWDTYRDSGEAARYAKQGYDNIHTQPLRSLLDQVEDTSVQLWAPYSIPTLSTWHRGRTCLIGDSAHALPPNGQGTAMAFEDAAYLGRLLGTATGKLPDAIFSHFERIRKPRLDQVKKLSNRTGGALKTRQDPDSWGWWLKRWMMWGYFTVWNRGQVKAAGFSGYDVMDLDADIK